MVCLTKPPRERTACLLLASEIALCLDVLGGMSSQWPLARNCHVVLSDLQQTLQRSMHPFTRSPRVRGRSSTPGNTSQPNQNCQQVAESGSPDRVNRSKRKRTDHDAPTGHISRARLDGPLPQMNVRPSHIDRQFDRLRTSGLCEPRPVEVDTDRRTSITPLFPSSERTGLNFQGNQPSYQLPQQQHGSPPALQHDPIAIAPRAGGTGLTAFPPSGVGDDATAQMGLHNLSDWDGGMPDLLGGATWESLLNVISRDNLGLDDQFL